MNRADGSCETLTDTHCAYGKHHALSVQGIGEVFSRRGKAHPDRRELSIAFGSAGEDDAATEAMLARLVGERARLAVVTRGLKGRQLHCRFSLRLRRRNGSDHLPGTGAKSCDDDARPSRRLPSTTSGKGSLVRQSTNVQVQMARSSALSRSRTGHDRTARPGSRRRRGSSAQGADARDRPRSV